MSQENWLISQWDTVPQDRTYLIKLSSAHSRDCRQIVEFLSTGQYKFHNKAEEIWGLLVVLYAMDIEIPDAVFVHALSTQPEVIEAVNSGRYDVPDHSAILTEIWGPLLSYGKGGKLGDKAQLGMRYQTSA